MNDIAIIRATNCHDAFCIVDADLFPELNRHLWHKHPKGYFRLNAAPNTPMHRVVNQTTAGMETDHENRFRQDNTRRNLRSATCSQNRVNKEKFVLHGTSRFKGVYWAKHAGRWMARIGINGGKKYLGYFDSEQGAAIAYNAAAKQHYGEFALLNQV